MQVLLLDLVVIFGLSVMAAILCHRLRIPTSIGLLLAGVLAGPDALALVRSPHDIELLAEVGVVLLLFVVGLEISVADVSRLRREFIIGGSLQFFGTAAVSALALLPMGMNLPQAGYIGCVVALSSTAVVLRMLQERAEIETPHGRAILSTLIYQDIAVVPVMLTAPLLAGLGQASLLPALSGLVLKVVVVAALALLAYRWIVPWVLEHIIRTRSSEAFLLGVFMLCVGIALITQSLGLSLALGAFLAGFILSESRYSHQAVAVMLPFRDVLMSLFFISVGMLLDIPFLLAHPVRIALLTLAVLLVKPLIAAAAALVTGLPLRSAVLAGLPLGQVGEFSLVATQAAVAVGLLTPDVFQSVLDVAVLSMMATPLLVAASAPLSERLCGTWLIHLQSQTVDPSAAQELEGELPRSGHVLIIGFGVTGRNVARCARRCGVPYAVVELNGAIVRRASEAGEPIRYGDATHAPILELVHAEGARAIVVVIDDPGAARRIVEIARRVAPEAYILVRSRYLREVEPLMALGADEVIADELEVSIEVFSRVMARMLVPREDIQRLIGDVRGHWRQMARTLAASATSVADLKVALPHLATHTLRLKSDSPLVGTTIAASGLRLVHGVTVLAVTRADGATIADPRGATGLETGDILFVIGPEGWDPRSLS
ncbi:cation:proton antiporter [Cyanobium gracile]|uniref:Cation:proton antiporter n=1 Tax=Cyanobium gracile UHCC 0281 TaxID=3110309 RepID=A0ABU5SZ95_9CYAN|nr:cation:proton antiporter [Cyanobium gracile]MEA5443806.1 cation:proton antiporter [Cyanobium gracile UHCC 0281]